MKFKVGDKVRVTREGLAKQAESSFVKSYEISWWTIEKIAGDAIYCPNKEYWYEEKHLELVPEEPEFEFGEEIEVGDEDWRRRKRIFLLKIPWNVIDPYVVVERGSDERFQFGESHDVEVWRYARKVPTQLTRKEVAEKFWVSENFVLVED